ncbi:hypothetical protein FGO68_gene8196 [Halteria grandinella]|uniref:Uncharacterized protein n=1 Tax=Halteria grandinella TaxID=5974 RepID=A0A8J8N8S5_HALGN|nr:hypothetical protein FGO68_gene8196 [Halteria grandinella]
MEQVIQREASWLPLIQLGHRAQLTCQSRLARSLQSRSDRCVLRQILRQTLPLIFQCMSAQLDCAAPPHHFPRFPRGLLQMRSNYKQWLIQPLPFIHGQQVKMLGLRDLLTNHSHQLRNIYLHHHRRPIQYLRPLSLPVFVKQLSSQARLGLLRDLEMCHLARSTLKQLYT